MRYLTVGMSLLALFVVLAYVKYDDERTRRQLRSYGISGDEGSIPDRIYNARSIELPSEMTFAGEKIPLDRIHVRERLYRELLVNSYWHSNTILMITEANRWLPQIEKILKKNGLPTDFKYIPVIEGSLRNDVSPAGAVGFWQLLAATARENGLEVSSDVDERYHPLRSTEAASKYLLKAYERFNSWTEVAASYNRGMAGLNRAIDDQKTEDYFNLYLNDETARYVYRILAIKLVLENPAKYGFLVDEEHLYEETPLQQVTIEESIPDLPEYAKKELGISYGILRYYNPWLRDYKLTVPKGKSYVIDLPKD